MTKILSFAEIGNIEFEILSKLDSNLVDKYGISFSNEKWNRDNFKYELPSKYKLSYIYYENNLISGYIVSSLKNNSIYVHRFAINKKGLANDFFTKVLEKYNQSIYLMVNIENKQAIKFYKNFSFYIVENIDIIKKFIANGLKIKENIIYINKEYRCYLMKRD